MDDPLIQTCTIKPQETLKFATRRNDSPVHVKNLLTVAGKLWTARYTTRRIEVIKGDIRSNFTYTFEEGCVIADVDAMTMHDGSIGLVCGVNKESAAVEGGEQPPYFVALLISDYGITRYTRQIAVSDPVTCVLVAVSEPDMEPFREATIYDRLGIYPHLIFIGTKNGKCILGAFPPIDMTNQGTWDHTGVECTTDILAPFQYQDKYRYQAETSTLPHCFPLSKVETRTLAYIPHLGIILCGMSFGGIHATSLIMSSEPHCLHFHAPFGAVKKLTFLEPENDDKAGVYIAAAYESEKRAHFIFFGVDIFENRAIASAPKFQFTPDRGVSFLAMDTIVVRKKKKDPNESSIIIESMTKRVAILEKCERTVLYLLYSTQDKTIKGSLFDLNAHYSRRLTSDVRFDPLIGQCHFLSSFQIDLSKLPTEYQNPREYLTGNVSLGLLSHPLDVRFASPIFATEHIFSAMSFNTTIRLFGKEVFVEGQCPSMHEQVLDRLASMLAEYFAEPSRAMPYLSAVGLSLLQAAPVDDKVPSSMACLLRALLAHGYAEEITVFAREKADRRQRLLLAKWLLKEIEEYTLKMDETLGLLFDCSLHDLDTKSTELLEYIFYLYQTASGLFAVLHQRSSDELDQAFKHRQRLRTTQRICECLATYVCLAQFLTKILPPAEPWIRAMNREVAEVVVRRRDAAAEKRRTLNLDSLLSRIHEKTRDDDLWVQHTPEDWYPPALFNLLAVIRKHEVCKEDKAMLLLYYLTDCDDVISKHDGEFKPNSWSRSTISALIASRERMECLGIDEEKLANVKELWRADNGEGESAPTKSISSHPLKESSNEDEIRQLVEYPWNRLPVEDEKRLKELLLRSGEVGIFRWNLYLMKKRLLHEVEDVPIPAHLADHPTVQQYRKLLPFALKHAIKGSRGPVRGPPVAKTAKVATTPLAEVAAPQLFKNVTMRGRTPRRLTVHPIAQPLDLTQNESVMTTTMTTTTTTTMVARGEENTVEEMEEQGDEMPEDVLRLQNLLRTPRDRARNAALREGRLCMDRTPEQSPHGHAVCPTSILKSAKKPDNQSAAKPRLRFAEALEQEHEISGREAGHRRLRQPDFDDEDEMESTEKSSTVNEDSSELQQLNESPESSLEVYKDVENRSDDVERSMEVQDEDETEENGEVVQDSVETRPESEAASTESEVGSSGYKADVSADRSKRITSRLQFDDEEDSAADVSLRLPESETDSADEPIERPDEPLPPASTTSSTEDAHLEVSMEVQDEDESAPASPEKPEAKQTLEVEEPVRGDENRKENGHHEEKNNEDREKAKEAAKEVFFEEGEDEEEEEENGNRPSQEKHAVESRHKKQHDGHEEENKDEQKKNVVEEQKEGQNEHVQEGQEVEEVHEEQQEPNDEVDEDEFEDVPEEAQEVVVVKRQRVQVHREVLVVEEREEDAAEPPTPKRRRSEVQGEEREEEDLAQRTFTINNSSRRDVEMDESAQKPTSAGSPLEWLNPINLIRRSFGASSSRIPAGKEGTQHEPEQLSLKVPMSVVVSNVEIGEDGIERSFEVQEEDYEEEINLAPSPKKRQSTSKKTPTAKEAEKTAELTVEIPEEEVPARRVTRSASRNTTPLATPLKRSARARKNSEAVEEPAEPTSTSRRTTRSSSRNTSPEKPPRQSSPKKLGAIDEEPAVRKENGQEEREQVASTTTVVESTSTDTDGHVVRQTIRQTTTTILVSPRTSLSATKKDAVPEKKGQTPEEVPEAPATQSRQRGGRKRSASTSVEQQQPQDTPLRRSSRVRTNSVSSTQSAPHSPISKTPKRSRKAADPIVEEPAEEAKEEEEFEALRKRRTSRVTRKASVTSNSSVDLSQNDEDPIKQMLQKYRDQSKQNQAAKPPPARRASRGRRASESTATDRSTRSRKLFESTIEAIPEDEPEAEPTKERKTGDERDQDSEPNTPVKRKRGRPPRKVSDISKRSPTPERQRQAASQPATTSAARGRKPAPKERTPSPEPEASTSTARRRGRPPKVASSAPSTPKRH